MIEAVPKHIFSNDYILRASDGQLAELDVSSWRERAEFVLDGASYRLYRDGIVGPFVLEVRRRDRALELRVREAQVLHVRKHLPLEERGEILHRAINALILAPEPHGEPFELWQLRSKERLEPSPGHGARLDDEFFQLGEREPGR